ncbi:MAG: DnaJ domain-containing protein [Lachnospiraceae bacterium]|nr:DnaJ domain-containing protein [Lachnospiraceae bacterium]
MRNYYDILGVSRDATQSQIKAAYRELAKKYHPDSASDNEENKLRFQEIQEAYSVLSDPEKRKQYNACGHEAYRKMNYTRYSSADDWPSGETREGHCGACAEGQKPPEDDITLHVVRIAVRLNLEETFESVIKEASYTEKIPNPAPGALPKYIDKTWRFKVRIPKGSFENQMLPLEAVICEGDELIGYLRSKYPDNFYAVIVLLQDKPGFLRQAYHLFTHFTVDYHTLVLGGTVHIPTLQGDKPFEIPAGTSPEQKLRLPGQGLIQPPKIGGRGDLYVFLHVRIPTELTPAQQAALLQLKKAFEAESV